MHYKWLFWLWLSLFSSLPLSLPPFSPFLPSIIPSPFVLSILDIGSVGSSVCDFAITDLIWQHRDSLKKDFAGSNFNCVSTFSLCFLILLLDLSVVSASLKVILVSTSQVCPYRMSHRPGYIHYSISGLIVFHSWFPVNIFSQKNFCPMKFNW